MGGQIIHKRGVFPRQTGRLDMIGEKLERIGRANVVFVAAPRVLSHFLHRMLADANLAVLDRPESFDPIVEQGVQPAPEALGLLVAEIADMEGRVLEPALELRAARLPPADPQASKHGLATDCLRRRDAARATGPAFAEVSCRSRPPARAPLQERRPRRQMERSGPPTSEPERTAPQREEGAMSHVIYTVVEHDGGWAYKVGDVFSETFATRKAAHAAAERAAEEQRVPGETSAIEYEDSFRPMA